MAAWALCACLLCPAGARAEMVPLWSLHWLDAQAPSSLRSLARASASGDAVVVAFDVAFDSQDHATFLFTPGNGATGWVDQEAGPSHALAALPMPPGRVTTAAYRHPVPGVGILTIRVLDAVSGGLLWERTAGATDDATGIPHARRLAVGVDGTVYVAEGDGGAYVVLRFDAQGKTLPAWRWPTGQESATPTDILALSDTGVVVTGYANPIGGGYRSVRFDAKGEVLFTDIESGSGPGHPLGPAHVASAPGGGFLLAATPESSNGVAQLRVWKLSATGARAWTRDWISPNPFADTVLAGLASPATGDALVGVGTMSHGALHLLRLDAGDGTVRVSRQWKGTSALNDIRDVAIADDARVLTTAYRSGDLHSLIEWTLDGGICRLHEQQAEDLLVAAGTASGWTLAGIASEQNRAGLDIMRFDSVAPCDVDPLFGNGFDGTLD